LWLDAVVGWLVSEYELPATARLERKPTARRLHRGCPPRAARQLIITAHHKVGQLIIVGRLKKRARFDIAEARRAAASSLVAR
jgi:hypothetical protein